MYKDTLCGQWKNLYSDFAQEYDRLTAHGAETGDFDRWYETRIHRWRSVSYTEGVILEQTENDALKAALLDEMAAFRFETVEPQPEQPVWRGFAAALAAGVFASLVLWALHWSTWRVILSGVVLCGVVAAGFWRSVQTAREKERNRIKDAYVDQLKAHGEKLAAVCDTFELPRGEGEGEDAHDSLRDTAAD